MPLDGTTFDRRERNAAVLRDALVLLRKFGWCQGRSLDSAGRFCLFGAIRRAGGLRTWADWKAIGIPSPVPFNDAPGRTQAEAESWLEEQITLCEEVFP